MAWSQAHVGNKIEEKGETFVDTGKCKVCLGKGRVTCEACQGKLVCSTCKGKGIIQGSKGIKKQVPSKSKLSV